MSKVNRLANYCLNPTAGVASLRRSEALHGARRGLGMRWAATRVPDAR